MKKKKILIIGIAVGVIVLSLAIFLILTSYSYGDAGQTPEVQPEEIEQGNDSQESSHTEEKDAVIESGEVTPSYRQAQSSTSQQSTNFVPSSNDNTDTPLCSRTDLSYTDAEYCASLLRQKMDEENRQQIEAARDKWCKENVPTIYGRYNNELLSENSRYEKEVENYISSHINSGASGSESTFREVAEKQYGPLHTQMVNSIVGRYISEVQSHGCDLSNYSF